MKLSLRRDFLKMTGWGLLAPWLAGPVAAAEKSTEKSAEKSPQLAVHKSAEKSTGTSSRSSHHGISIRDFGAKGDGVTLDSPAINRAIEAAVKQGGGTVFFPAGDYLSYTVRLKSNISLYLDQGAVLIAADPPASGRGGYDAPEPAQNWDGYQDYGHNHWRDSLIWGDGLNDVSIMGPGRIWGRGLSKGYGPGPTSGAPGVANKAIALKNCRNVTLSGFQILQGGWFGILATGVDNLLIDGLTIDTNRDGMDIDCCRNVRISGCAVNSPWDDAIVPKSSLALGFLRATENLTISDCYVTAAYKLGTMLDGTFQKWTDEPDIPRTGRIKLGTESNGGFKNIAISNCVFEGGQGLALESVDGALLEDIVISNIVMRDITSAPLFLRLGSRLRGAEGTKVGALRRVLIHNLVCSHSVSTYGSIISGVPGFPIEDVRISNVHIQHQGGGTKAQAELRPPEKGPDYPEPNMFGPMPSYGFYVRHANNIEFSDVKISTTLADARPAFFLSDVDGIDLHHLSLPEPMAQVARIQCEQVKNLVLARVKGCDDFKAAHITRQSI